MRETKLLARKLIKTNKLHSVFVGIAVILTAVMFTTIISITVSLYQSTEIIYQLSSGYDFHAFAIMSDLKETYSKEKDEQFFEKIKSHTLVKEAYIWNDLGRYFTDEDDVTSNKYHRIYSSPDKNILSHMFAELTDGQYPKNSSEILFNSYFDSTVKTGDTITLYDNLGNPCEFKVSGIFTSMADKHSKPMGFTNQSGDERTSFSDIMLILNNTLNIDGKMEKIREDTGIDFRSYNIRSYFTSNADFFNGANIIFMTITVLVVFFCGFLLIYNIYYISITRDMKMYGLLKSLGTTKKQLRAIVRSQVNIIYIISLPIGLILGYFIGWKTLSPIFMSLSGQILDYKFNWMIFIFTIVFTYLTMVISSLAPVGKIAKMSCISAIKESESHHIKAKIKKSEKGMVPWRMALSNMRKDKKKNAITILSVSLSIVVFVMISILVYMFEQLEAPDIFDFKLGYEYSEKYTYETVTEDGEEYVVKTSKNLLSDDLEKIKSIDGVTEVYPILEKTVQYSPSGELYDKMKAAYSDISQEYLTYQYELAQAIKNEYINVTFWAIPDDFLYDPSSFRLYEGEYSERNFKSGKYAVISKYSDQFYDFYSYYNVGDKITMDILKNEYTVMLQMETPGTIMSQYSIYSSVNPYRLTILLPYSMFIKEFDDALIDTICFNIDPEKYEQVKSELTSMFGADKYKIEDRQEGLEELRSRVSAVRIVGYSLSIIMLLIGVMNYVNSLICGVYARRHEFALLEAVGMTTSQLKRMQIFEGIYFIAINLVISIAVSVPCITKMFSQLIKMNIPMNFGTPVIMIAILAVVAFATIIAALRIISRETTIERLKISE